MARNGKYVEYEKNLLGYLGQQVHPEFEKIVIPTTAISKNLNIPRSSVHDVIKLLQEKKFVRIRGKRHNQISLTIAGKNYLESLTRTS